MDFKFLLMQAYGRMLKLGEKDTQLKLELF